MHHAMIEVNPQTEGLFRATCHEAPGVWADGASPEEAEEMLLRLLEIRVDLAGPVRSPRTIAADPDLVPGATES